MSHPAADGRADVEPTGAFGRGGVALAAIRATIGSPAAGERSSATVPGPRPRPKVAGPFLWLGDEKFVVKAVTYGSFAADAAGAMFPPLEVVRRDLRAMRSANVNTIRTYTPPPDWLLEEARHCGLRVLVGIDWDGRNCTFDDPRTLRTATAVVRETVERCRRFPDVVLAYSLGNEIPPLVIRYHGPRVIERFLARLCHVARRADPDALVTYASFPSTEYLELEFVDFHTMNVYLLEPTTLSAYLDRVLMLAKGKPVLLGEVGEDSLRRGEAHQARILDWTIPLALDKGLAGLCVFGWTDEWVVGGHHVTDWRFGLVDTERRPKPALDVVRRCFGQSALERRRTPWPRVSVVVCNYNGDETLAETLASLVAIDYPDYEVIYVDDGSTDDSLAIARRYQDRIRIIEQENRGLGVARNVGAEAATGDVVAYIDSDAYADSDWLRYLVLAMESNGAAAAGGPNLTPPTDGLMAQLIATCPGNPACVMTDDVQADHVAGVNMAFRRDALLSIGGFDPIHRKAGDDVDVCWRLLDASHRIAFAPAAIVWHHRRPSIRRYLKQQFGYGEAENQLERKHPERFNLGGYIRWRGRVYQAPRRSSSVCRPFVYHGTFGTAMFQTLYQRDASCLTVGPTMVHWHLLWLALLMIAPLYPWTLPLAGALALASVWVAVSHGIATLVPVRLSPVRRVQKVVVIALLHLVQPIVRFVGRIDDRLGRRRKTDAPRPGPALGDALSELPHVFRRRRQARGYLLTAEREDLLRALQRELKERRVAVAPSSEWSTHDLHVNGTFGAEGRIYSAPDRWGTALRVAYQAQTPEAARIVNWVLLGVAGAAIAVTPWGAVLLAAPGAAILRSMGQRARLRQETWLAIDRVMTRAGGRRCDPGAAG